MFAYRVRRTFNGGALGEFRVGEYLDAEGFRLLKNGKSLIDGLFLELKDTGSKAVEFKKVGATPTSKSSPQKPATGTKRAGRRT